MYEELRGNLMAQATHFSVHDETSLLLLKAADAIEELQKKYDETQGALITADITRIYLENVLKYIKTLAEYYKAHNRWIPVTERLPPISEEVIVFADRTMIRIWSLERYHPTIADVFWEREDGYHEDVDVVSHWMPLPQPPESEGE